MDWDFLTDLRGNSLLLRERHFSGLFPLRFVFSLKETKPAIFLHLRKLHTEATFSFLHLSGGRVNNSNPSPHPFGFASAAAFSPYLFLPSFSFATTGNTVRQNIEERGKRKGRGGTRVFLFRTEFTQYFIWILTFLPQTGSWVLFSCFFQIQFLWVNLCPCPPLPHSISNPAVTRDLLFPLSSYIFPPPSS